MGKVVTLGEIMLRLSTEQGTRIDSSERFAAHYGGGEANVAISLANYGHEAILLQKYLITHWEKQSKSTCNVME